MKHLKVTETSHETKCLSLNSANKESKPEMAVNSVSSVCPNLDSSDLKTCRAGNRSYMPSLFQCEGYCKSRFYPKCPFYLGYHL